MQEIQLTRGRVALVDDEDYEWLNQWTWSVRRHVNKNQGSIHWYTQRGFDSASMHRLILNIHGTDLQGDHIDGDGLNNQRHNLRIVTSSQNHMNQRKRFSQTSSIYKGVSWDSVNRKWVVRIKVNGVQKNVGRFTNEKLAAKVYDRAALSHFGEYANLNFPL